MDFLGLGMLDTEIQQFDHEYHALAIDGFLVPPGATLLISVWTAFISFSDSTTYLLETLVKPLFTTWVRGNASPTPALS